MSASASPASSISAPLELATALYQFINDAEKVTQKGAERLSAWAAELARRFAESTQNIPSAGDIAARLTKYAQELQQDGPASPRLRALWHELGNDYERLFAHLRRLGVTARSSGKLDHVKPRNLSRNLFHVANGVLAVVLYELVWDRWGMFLFGAAVLVSFVGLDVLRRVAPSWNSRLVGRIFGKISRPGEAYTVPSATFYLIALLIALLVLPQRACEIGALVLAFGDPAASLAGKAWGKRKLWRDKSLAGTLAFAVMSFVVTGGFMLLVHEGVGRSLAVAALAAVAGAIAELFSRRLDDNFTIPLLAGGVAALLLS